MRIRSMKWRLIAGMLLGWTLVFVIGGASVYLSMTKHLYEKFDEDLLQRAHSIQGMIREPHEADARTDIPDFEWRELGSDFPSGFSKGRDYTKVVDAETGLVYHVSGGIKGEGPPRNRGSEAKVYPVELENGKAARCVELWFYPESEMSEGEVASGEKKFGRELILQVAKRDSVKGELERLREKLIWFWLVGLLGGGGVTMFVVWINLRPLRELRDEIGRLDYQDLGRRVVLGEMTSELEPVTAEVNGLLDRLEGAFQRERVMTSNVAHELRTPVAGLLANLEVTLAGDREKEDYRAAGEECLGIAKRMHWLVNNLLTLSRLEADHARPKMVVIDLEQELRMRWRRLAVVAQDKEVSVIWDVRDDVGVETDPEYLRVLMGNVFENAVAYVSAGGRIEVKVESSGRICVRNTIVGFDPDGLEKVFDPFWRDSKDRGAEGNHAGLGLSICKRVVAKLGGRIDVRLSGDGGWFEVVVNLNCRDRA